MNKLNKNSNFMHLAKEQRKEEKGNESMGINFLVGLRTFGFSFFFSEVLGYSDVAGNAHCPSNYVKALTSVHGKVG